MRRELEIIGGSNYGLSNVVDNERSINIFPHADKYGNKALLPCPGLTLAATFAQNKMRQLYVYRDKMYAVVGSKVYQVDSTLNINELASLTTSTGYVGYCKGFIRREI